MQFLNIELVNKSIYKPDRIVYTHLFFQGSEKGLITVISLYELHGVIYPHFTTVLVLMHISVYLNEQASFFTDSRSSICEGREFIARLPGTNAQLKICC